MLQDKENYSFDIAANVTVNAFDEGYKQGVRDFANFLKSFMGMERDCVGIKYKQGIFSDYEIDDLVEEFNNMKEN